ncbi:MAG: hypothetical protein M5U31_09745 [Acidimicrobiia bacterium]|nr:hypothetical protein [Acidimicrobiia bacterium]
MIFDRDPESVILRQNDVGELEIWTEEDGWQPYEPGTVGGSALTSALTPSAAGVFDDGALHLLPQSVSTAGAAAGGDRAEIAPFEDLDLVAGTDEWFAVGDRVVVNPGADNEEYATIAGFGSLVFTEPLQHDHRRAR